MFKHSGYYTVTNVRFEFRKGRRVVGTTHMGTVYAVITIEGQKQGPPVSTRIRCTRSTWDELDKPKHSYAAKDLNRKMTLWEDSIYAAAKNLRDEGEIATPATLVEEKNRAGNNITTLDRIYKQFVDYKKNRVGSSNSLKRKVGEISPATFQTYNKRWVYLSKFIKEKKLTNMPAHKADAPFVESYYSWLQTQKMSLTTATKYAKLLTEVLTWAVRNGAVKGLHVQGFTGQGTAEKPPHNVTEEEVCRIEALDYSLDPRMAHIRDGWLLARELCLHWADYMDLKPEHFSLNKNNQMVFEKSRQKQEAGRDIRQLAYVSDRALAIWKRYGRKIPIACPNSKFNYALAEIGYLAELNEPLVFSHARDSGIFRWVALGVPDTHIRLAAGWRSMEQIGRYVNLDRRLLDELSTHATPSPTHPNPQPFFQVYKAS